MLKKSKFWLILLISVALLPLLDFFKPGLPLTHDGQDHVARLASFYQSLAEGNLVPRWAGDLNWLYGTPVLMFFYPLPSYFGSLFHFMSFSFVDSAKIVFGLSFVLSGVFMFLWIKEIWGKQSGFAAGLVYMFASYRFVDLYVRGAIGECWGFVWPPLICWFALKFAQKPARRYLAGGSLSLAALILSHNALSLMFLPVIFGYMIYLVFSIPKAKFRLSVISYLLSVILGFGLAAFFWFPAFFEAKYTLRDIVTKDNIMGFKNFFQLLWTPWNYGGTELLSVQLGVLQWLAVGVAPLAIWQFWRQKSQAWRWLLFLLVCFGLAIFLILPAAQSWYLKISLLQKFQFAWRFLSLAVLPPAVFTAAEVYLLPQKFKLPVISGLLLAILIFNQNFWHAKDFLVKQESFYTQNYPGSTNDTGESSPIWSTRAMYQFSRAPLEVIEGEAEIKQIERKTTKHVYQAMVQKETRLVDNTLYFPGWQVLVDGQSVEIEFQDPAWRGLMTFNVPAGEHEIAVRFSETKLRLLADLISLGSLLLLVGSAAVIKFKKYQVSPARWAEPASQVEFKKK
ncbi:hypothetical protein COT66_00410 [Candidatus Shapirobacteria bacterium CG09_land_8_20_14_0_10_49_15]|uniref:Membrane protein 6-pyruvoyl-tetrahydropterin synthase-related domain-containing protein n=2 Tax=Candidatus Shapironibacteriota TaxID=1752721 RepID=A0A2M8L6Z7_9BACT|nr:MAG: hypothetical protein COT66_00410 [Candidatus Shapirobacteria bacterium CG09_land_8_20_14_0_10_49_15]PJE70015.1 MAG: hypothetical protein COU97_01995 [Candidatus Shapirobacteria bacterium CG10_big_fil_rev_8_21_14_0_10_48_15]